eukprot:Pompholyxophrys_punicea_v1_NODE_493_length_1798_cov_6.648800.p2 type:complete len:190 gc:universal NODE_493_length_1798_cov_6.648800:1042-473(-)
MFSRVLYFLCLDRQIGSCSSWALLWIFGPPKIIQSDNGSEFTNQVVHELVKLLKIDQRCTSPYHPRANGTAERHVQTVSIMIKKLLSGEIVAWKQILPATQLMINAKISTLHGVTPFTAMFMRSLNGFDNFTEHAELGLTSLANAVKSRLQAATEIVMPALKQSAQDVMMKRKTVFDATHKLLPILTER